MLMMIQKVFYGGLGLKSLAIAGWDLDAREHLALWPLVLLFFAMGIASPYWMKAIDTAGTAISEDYRPTPTTALVPEITTQGGQR
jgi:NADH-quinone oxidoreductase subunit M